MPHRTSLSSKLLARPRLLREIRALIPNPARSHLIPYNTTPLERDVALSLGIPMYGADPRLAELGSKTGCRRMFEELGVPCPVGAEDLHTLDDIVAGVQSMRARRPSLAEAIVKLNEGVSGSGNALVDLHGLPAPGSPDEAAAITERLLGMQLEAEKLTIETYLAAFEKNGGIVEERITGVALTSPSVQMRALPDGTVELLSTHDQLLGGKSGQKYLGCVFPADAELRREHRRARDGDRPASRDAGRARAVRRGFRCRTRRERHLDAVRDRTEPPQGRDHPSVPDPAVPHRRDLRRCGWRLPDSQRQQQVSGRHRPPRGRPAQGTDRRRNSSTSW